MRIWVVAFGLLTLTARANAADTAALWGRWEKAFTAVDAATTDPDTELTIELTSPTGKTRKVSGFWDGANTWRVRFRPDEPGDWRYTTRSQPKQNGLDGGSGSFTCARGQNKTPFLQHGSVGVAPDGTHFEHADGTPFFWLGDTVWYGAILSAKNDWDTYLGDRVG